MIIDFDGFNMLKPPIVGAFPGAVALLILGQNARPSLSWSSPAEFIVVSAEKHIKKPMKHMG